MKKDRVNAMNPRPLADLINEIIVKSTILASDKSIIEGLTPRQVHMIKEIDNHIYRHGDLAARLGVEPSTLTRTLDPLVKKGIVERNLNPDNRREVLIRLSAKGALILKQIDNKMNEVCTHILEQIPRQYLPQVEQSILLLLNAMKQVEISHGAE